MGVRFACHGCGKPLNIKTELAGKRGKCPACGLRFRIPLEDQELSIPLETSSTQAGEAPESTDSGPSTKPDAPATLSSASMTPQQEEVLEETPAAENEFDPLDDPQAQWYVRPPSGGRYGPADSTTLRLWISEGRITPDTLLWRDGWTQWRSGEEVIPQWIKERQTPPTPGSAPEPVSATTASQSTSRGDTSPFTPAGTEAPASPSVPIPIAPQSAPQFDVSTLATKPLDTSSEDPYPRLKRRKRTNQRTIIIVCLVISVILLAALIAALLWPTETSPEAGETSYRPIWNHQIR